jgi:hypothetical protein
MIGGMAGFDVGDGGGVAAGPTSERSTRSTLRVEGHHLTFTTNGVSGSSSGPVRSGALLFAFEDDGAQDVGECVP